LTGGGMHVGRLVFAQVMDLLPLSDFRRCVARYPERRPSRTFSCLDQFLCMAFAQLTTRESLRDIESCLRAVPTKLYHLGIRGAVCRTTLADANERRDWRIFADFAQVLITEARELYAKDTAVADLKQTIYALDSTTIDLCLELFPWAKFRRTKAAVKLHTLIDLRGSIPTFIHITDGKVHDVNALDVLTPEPGAYYIMDRGYQDLERFHRLHLAGSFFVTRPKTTLLLRRIQSQPVDKTTGVRSDWVVMANGVKTATAYPERLRRIRFRDVETKKTLVFITNDFVLPAHVIAALYKARWQVELFFKWVKQHLRIKSFFGTSENAVKTQVWIAMSVYVLIAILRKTMSLDHLSPWQISQVLSLTCFEKRPVNSLFLHEKAVPEDPQLGNQLSFLDF
jgi:IS4 transposase